MFADRAFLAITLIVALALRLLHWHSVAHYPWFDFLGLDAKYYDDWAQHLLEHGLQGKDPYFMGPLYPHVLALIYAIFGRDLTPVRALQIALSVATVALVYVLATRVATRAVARVAAAFAAVYGPFVYYSVSILYPTLLIFLSAALMLGLWESARRRSVGLAFGAGALLGLYALGNAGILLFAPVALAWLLVAWGRPERPRWAHAKSGWRAGAALTAGAILLVLPATIHNVRAGDPTLLTTNGGLNFYIGNGPMASGGHETPVLFWETPDGTTEEIVADLHQDVECRTEAEYALGRTLSYTEVSSFWMDQTLRVIRADPSAFAARLVMKAVHFWSTYEIPQIEHFGYFRQFSLPLRGPALTFLVIGPLSVVGMALGLRSPGRWLLLYSFVAVYSTSIILFFVLARYRLPILPALLVFAAFAVVEIVTAARQRRFAFVAACTGGALLCGWLMQANFYRVDEKKGIAQILYRHGIVEDSRGNFGAAIAHYRDALALKPEYDRCHLNLAGDLARLGRHAEAMRHFLEAERLNPRYYRAPFNRGVLLEELGRLDEARDAYERAVELEPAYLWGQVALAEVEIIAGERLAARDRLIAVMEYEGRWQSEQNPVAKARADRMLAYLVERERLGERGRCFDGSAALRSAELARLRGRREVAIERLRAYFGAGGACAEAYHAFGQVLWESQQFDGAEDAFQRALAADPGFPGALLGLARLAALRGDGALAAEYLRRELHAEGSANDPAVYLELGLVHERLLGNAEEAERAYSEYLAHGGDRATLAARRATPRAPADR